MKPGIVDRKPSIAAGRVAAAALACLLLGGCSLLGGGERESTTIYAPDPRIAADPSWPSVQWRLEISPTTSARMLDSLRIAVAPTPGEIQVYKGASWSKPPCWAPDGWWMATTRRRETWYGAGPRCSCGSTTPCRSCCGG